MRANYITRLWKENYIGTTLSYNVKSRSKIGKMKELHKFYKMFGLHTTFEESYSKANFLDATLDLNTSTKLIFKIYKC